MMTLFLIWIALQLPVGMFVGSAIKWGMES
jgi:hypothetical protein